MLSKSCVNVSPYISEAAASFTKATTSAIQISLRVQHKAANWCNYEVGNATAILKRNGRVVPFSTTFSRQTYKLSHTKGYITEEVANMLLEWYYNLFSVNLM